MDAKAIVVTGLYICPFFFREANPTALALRDAAGLTLKYCLTTGAMLFFVFAHYTAVLISR